MPLRSYQTTCLSNIADALDAGVHQQAVVMATGTGKSPLFANLPTILKSRIPGQMMILAHRETLIDQAIAHVREWNPSLRVDKEMADFHADPNADVIVASVASVGRAGAKRAERFNWDNITTVVVDEMHHSCASTYMNVFELAGVLKPDTKKLLLGVTATPSRGDGLALGAIYKKVVYQYLMWQAIDEGWLVDVRGIRLNTQTSLDGVKTVAGDFAQDQLADAVNNPVRNQLVVKAWIDHAFGLQTIVFSVDIQHAKDLSATFERAGIKSAAIWGDDPNQASKLTSHRNRELQVLVNCQLLTEGYDDWRIACVLDAAPTKSSARYTQKVGRGTRLEEGTGNLLEALAAGKQVKSNCLVIDVVDNTTRHSLITLPTLVGLNADVDLKGKSAVRSAKAVEDAMAAHPHIDFSKLTDITKLKAYVENVNLFDVKFPVEVTNNSNLSWYPTQDAGYALMLPAHERIVIKQNMLDKYEINAVLAGQKYAGVRDTLDQAFAAADGLVNDKLPSVMKLLTRAAAWHDDPATDPQKRLLRKYYKGKDTPYCICAVTSTDKLCTTCHGRTDLTKGHAGRLISGFLVNKHHAAA
jgi:ATP-dependent helicase IRC3